MVNFKYGIYRTTCGIGIIAFDIMKEKKKGKGKEKKKQILNPCN
jgi:hypothetical protein